MSFPSPRLTALELGVPDYIVPFSCQTSSMLSSLSAFSSLLLSQAVIDRISEKIGIKTKTCVLYPTRYWNEVVAWDFEKVRLVRVFLLRRNAPTLVLTRVDCVAQRMRIYEEKAVGLTFATLRRLFARVPGERSRRPLLRDAVN